MSSFDWNSAVRFDLGRGHVSLNGDAGDSARRSNQVLIPAEALSTLCAAAPQEQVIEFGRRLGHEIGLRLSQRLSSELTSARAETLVEHLGGELALLGFGSLSLELWGRALVFTFIGSPLQVEGSAGSGPAELLLAAVIEGALGRAMSRDVRAAPIFRGAGVLRLLVCNARAKDQVLAWLSEGRHYGEALARLNETRGAEA